MNPKRKAGDPLTPRQAELLAKLIAYVDANDRPPTLREISALMGKEHPCSMQFTLRCLEEKGRIDRSKNIARGLSILSRDLTVDPNCNGIRILSKQRSAS